MVTAHVEVSEMCHLRRWGRHLLPEALPMSMVAAPVDALIYATCGAETDFIAKSFVDVTGDSTWGSSEFATCGAEVDIYCPKLGCCHWWPHLWKF